MLKKTITFTGFDGVERTTDLYFNLTKTDLIDWSADSPQGIQYDMQIAIDNQDKRKLLDFVKDLIFRSYGIRDADGVHFDRSPEISRRFMNSAMYDALLLEIFGDEDGTVAAAFINGLMPPDLVKAAMKQANIPNPEEKAEVAASYAPSAREQFKKAQEDAQKPAEVVETGGDAAIHQPFRVKETPAMSPEELKEYEAWKASRGE